MLMMAGKGERLLSALGMKKQFWPLDDGRAMFLSSLKIFKEDSSFSSFVLIIRKEDEEKTRKLLVQEKLNESIIFAYGGDSREESVYNGLITLNSSLTQKEKNEARVFIHDADRPFLSQALLKRLEAEKKQAVIPFLPLTFSLYNLKKNKYEDRQAFASIQTPQVFPFDPLFQAFKKNEDKLSSFSDDGSIYQKEGGTCLFVKGEEDNIKISDSASLKQALYIAKEEK